MFQFFGVLHCASERTGVCLRRHITAVPYRPLVRESAASEPRWKRGFKRRPTIGKGRLRGTKCKGKQGKLPRAGRWSRARRTRSQHAPARSESGALRRDWNFSASGDRLRETIPDGKLPIPRQSF